jgi:hypothetical protein
MELGDGTEEGGVEGEGGEGDEDIDGHPEMSYVWPSKGSRGAAGSGTGGRYGLQRQTSRQSQQSAASMSVGYDVVESGPCGGGGGRRQDGGGPGSTRSDAYEKVSSCRYEHIWQMPLPKAPDE